VRYFASYKTTAGNEKLQLVSGTAKRLQMAATIYTSGMKSAI
jgi:hypothetical protein